MSQESLLVDPNYPSEAVDEALDEAWRLSGEAEAAEEEQEKIKTSKKDVGRTFSSSTTSSDWTISSSSGGRGGVKRKLRKGLKKVKRLITVRTRIFSSTLTLCRSVVQ